MAAAPESLGVSRQQPESNSRHKVHMQAGMHTSQGPAFLAAENIGEAGMVALGHV